MVYRGEEIRTSRNKTSEILTVYLKKWRIYIHLRGSINLIKQCHSIGSTKVMMVRGSTLTVRVELIFTVWKERNVLIVSKGNGGRQNLRRSGIRLGIWGSVVQTPAAPGNLWPRVAKKITNDSSQKQSAFNE